MSMVCIPTINVCDGIAHCPNGMDEKIMCTPSNSTFQSNCNDGQFECGDGECHPLYQLCDGKINCVDGFDEEEKRCTGFQRIFQVAGIYIDQEEDIGGDQVFMEWWVDGSIKSKLEFLPSWCITGTAQCSNKTEWTRDRKYLVENLKPYTNYNVTVYVRELSGNDHVYSPAVYKTFTTAESGSSPPRNVTVDQPDTQTLCVHWDKPIFPNGKITSYKIYRSPPIPPLIFHSKGTQQKYCFTSTLTDHLFYPGTNYSFWVSI